MTHQTDTTRRKLRIVYAIHDYLTAGAAHAAKAVHEARDGATYHVVCYGQQRYMLTWIVDEAGREIVTLRDDDQVDYCA